MIDDDIFPGIIVLGLGFLLGMAFMLAVGPSDDVASHTRAARKDAQALCAGHRGAVTFDVQDKNKLVYACRDDLKLKVLDY